MTGCTFPSFRAAQVLRIFPMVDGAQPCFLAAVRTDSLWSASTAARNSVVIRTRQLSRQLARLSTRSSPSLATNPSHRAVVALVTDGRARVAGRVGNAVLQAHAADLARCAAHGGPAIDRTCGLNRVSARRSWTPTPPRLLVSSIQNSC